MRVRQSCRSIDNQSPVSTQLSFDVVALSAREPSEMSVLLVEQHVLVLAALRSLIESTPGLSMVAEARTIASAREMAQRHRPDVVLIDGRTLARTGDGDLDSIRDAAPGACVLVLADSSLVSTGFSAAADGCLLEDAGPDELCALVASMLGARCANCRFRSACPIPQIAAALSRRERQVAVRVAEGMSTKQIAAALGIGTRTVNTYRESLARKVGASSPAVLTRFVLKSGLTDSTPKGGAHYRGG